MKFFICTIIAYLFQILMTWPSLSIISSPWPVNGELLVFSWGCCQGTSILLIPGGPPAYLEAVLTRLVNRAPPSPTLTKLCDAPRSHAVDKSRVALELEQDYQTQRTGLSAHKPRAGSSLELPNLKPTLYHHIYIYSSINT